MLCHVTETVHRSSSLQLATLQEELASTLSQHSSAEQQLVSLRSSYETQATALAQAQAQLTEVAASSENTLASVLAQHSQQLEAAGASLTKRGEEIAALQMVMQEREVAVVKVKEDAKDELHARTQQHAGELSAVQASADEALAKLQEGMLSQHKVEIGQLQAAHAAEVDRLNASLLQEQEEVRGA